MKIYINKQEKTVQVEICGLDIYDPIKDLVLARSLRQIAYWMVDDDYDDSLTLRSQRLNRRLRRLNRLRHRGCRRGWSNLSRL